MPTRRALLRDGAGAAVLAALAGCQSSLPTSRDTTTTTTQPESSGAGQHRLSAEPVAPGDVADGATVGVASPALHELVADAAERDGRVDLQTAGSADGDETLALGGFDYVEFGDQTYEPTASFARFSEETSYRYEVVAVDDSEVDEDGEVLAYADLTDEQQTLADEILDGGYGVGHHEEKPAAVEVFDTVDYLRADGDVYRIRVTHGDYAAHHMLTLDPADPSEDAQVVTVLDEPPAADWSDVLQEGLGPGSVGIEDLPSAEALVAYLRRVDYVVTATTVADATVNETVQ
jgi:hypothetical protein